MQISTGFETIPKYPAEARLQGPQDKFLLKTTSINTIIWHSSHWHINVSIHVPRQCRVSSRYLVHNAYANEAEAARPTLELLESVE